MAGLRWLLLLTGLAGAGAEALSPHVLVLAAGPTLIRLQAVDAQPAQSLAYTVTLPPEGMQGRLLQLSAVFSAYGYEPKGGAAVGNGSVVTGSGNRLYYEPPVRPRSGAPDRFFYRAEGSAFDGTVTVAGAAGELLRFDFSSDAQGWAVEGNQQPMGAAFDASSRGPLLSQFIYGSDDTVNLADGSDRSLWYFSAPPERLGNLGIVYGGTLSFALASFAGDFSRLNAMSTNVVELECASCPGPVARGLVVAMPMSALLFSGATTLLQLSLTEDAGWRTDPQNSLLAWPAASQCDLLRVLSALSGLRVLGDWTTGLETVALDALRFANTRGRIPRCAMTRPDASVCTC